MNIKTSAVVACCALTVLSGCSSAEKVSAEIEKHAAAVSASDNKKDANNSASASPSSVNFSVSADGEQVGVTTDKWPENLPRIEGAKVECLTASSSEGRAATCSALTTKEKCSAFFKDMAAIPGMKVEGSMGADTGGEGFRMATFIKGNEMVQVTAEINGDEANLVIIMGKSES